MKLETSQIGMSNLDIKRNVKLPTKLTKELAEFIGIMIGDGHLTSYDYINKKGQHSFKSDIVISGNNAEKEYLEFIMDLFYNLFNLKLSYIMDNRSNAIILIAHSKGIVNFLHDVCNIPVGKKTNIVRIPPIIFISPNYIKSSFLRGLADTDFTVTFKNRTNKGHNYPLIKGSFKSKNLIKDLEKIYFYFGFKFSTYYNEPRSDKRFADYKMHNIYLYGTSNFKKWVNKIGFSNNKFKRKIAKWEKDGVCPPGY